MADVNLMNGFTKKSIGTLTLGEKLKKLRSERRISLNEISRATKIQVRYLEYLEDGRYEKLPVDVYVKGFLKNYADFLGVSENALIRLYEKETGIKKNLEKSKTKKTKKPEPLNISAFVFTPRIIVASSIIILALGGLFYLYKEIGSFASIPRLVIVSPQPNSSISGNSAVVEGATDKDAKLYINDQPILVNDEGKFRESLTLQPGMNFINVKAVNRFEKEIAETITVQADYAPEGNSQEESEVQEEKKEELEGINVEIRIDPGPVWISVEVDDSLVFSGTMLTGAVQSFKGEGKVSVNSGRANATFIKFNGKDIGAIGEGTGPVRGVTFTAGTKY